MVEDPVEQSQHGRLKPGRQAIARRSAAFQDPRPGSPVRPAWSYLSRAGRQSSATPTRTTCPATRSSRCGVDPGFVDGVGLALLAVVVVDVDCGQGLELGRRESSSSSPLTTAGRSRFVLQRAVVVLDRLASRGPSMIRWARTGWYRRARSSAGLCMTGRATPLSPLRFHSKPRELGRADLRRPST